MSQHSVSIIIPCKNEEQFIYKVLQNIAEQTSASLIHEVIVSDGLSTDNTKGEIQKFQTDHPGLNVKLIDNPQQVVPFALNKAIEMSSGNIILRMDAHSIYPANYLERLLAELDAKPDAWNVGGCWDTQPGADTEEAKAIVAATSHPVGIGDADYRLEGSEVKKVDTVPFGCFRREVFDKIGLFDTDLVRNQDDELNARIIQNGGSIYLIPELKIKYFARPTVPKMSKMFFQYGYFKPLVNKKIKKPATLRQFAPPALVMAIALGWIPGIFWLPWLVAYTTGLWIYLVLLLVVAITMKAETSNRIQIFICFVVIHFSYGWGYLKGIFDFLIRGVEKKGKTVNISR